MLHDTVELDGAADRFVYDCARVINISDKNDAGRRRTSLLYRVVLGEDVEHEGVVAECYTHIHMPVSVCRFAQSMIRAYRALTNSRASSSEETGITARMGPNISL